ncbi:MAG TPA: T9SS type A sorting domain-containing protein [Chitinophagales bacterium]|nr:T9SS type A sorting domain-containing protein [Chitinophagales bacterium]HMX60609.1 T9SS type A sorting domain-containing protein [Chitinophagales bacterium]HMY23298.1 T9SS type A sorting domain-containing protein [Chitinophagales bacterium]HNA39594.1 T9SS type A sorting domain-containing protein [Chitinophagales bacterium]HNB47813.1 T9SS type A sorting domain-containing protein [Chitinophagales bacterium]
MRNAIIDYNRYIQQTCILLSLYFMIQANSILAQQYFRFDYLPVKSNNTSLQYPWTGGINNAQFGMVDVNHDNRKDLVVYNKSNNNFLIFTSTQNNSTQYHFSSKYAAHFPPVNGWFIMKDYNCDGIEDIFTYNNVANIKVYTAYYANDTLKFKLQQDGFFYQGVSGKINLYCSDVIKPALADVNKDGDLDVISFNVFGNRLQYYENQQKELALPCDSLFFTKADNCWGNVLDTLAAAYALNDTCTFKFNRPNSNENIMHTGSSLAAIDIDANETTDLAIGSIGLNSLTLLYNLGTKNYASIQQQDITFPNYNIPFDVSSFGSPSFVDANNDGFTDMLVSTFDVGTANINNIWYYKNTKTSGTPSIELALQQKNFLLENMIDAGENSYPCFFDADGDGLKDILLGSGGFKDYVQAAVYKLQLYKNIGNAEQAAFELIDDDYLGVSTLNVKDLAPAIGDIDNDNDTDIVVGLSDGKLIYWENTAITGNAPNLLYKGLLKDATGIAINVGANATPCLVDINRDGKTDLIIGERNGNLNYYTGNSIDSIDFAFVTDSLGKIRIKTNGLSIGFTQPTIADINNDSKYDLLLGTNISGLLKYYNIEDNLTGTFISSGNVVSESIGMRTSSTIADISNDTKAELLCGNIAGGLTIFSQFPPPIIPSTIYEKRLEEIAFSVFPNPANHSISVSLKAHFSNISVQIINTIGQEIFHQTYSNINTFEINTSTFNKGLYLLKINDGKNIGFQKILIQH